MANVGLLVPLVAKPEKSSAVADFLNTGYSLVPEEPLTLQWFAVSYESSSPPTYAIFDTFAADEGRDAHLNGKIAAALMQNAPELLGVGPQIGKVNVLASVVRPVKDGGKTAGVGCGLRVLIQAKPEKAGAVRDFLKNAVPLVEEEPETPYWYAIEFPGTNTFAIVDFFPDDNGRTAHVQGKVAAALFGSVDELLTGTPEIIKTQVLAARV
ncbi:hypothetical protein K435DRAFT_971911 [Dendrothele bispora CBS 962.96]|uniref:ABM domain-containing protein n=1 Tax=Dendrothele bispora (strain CBS 962.96) TaxID=1314807 RepID=A0A4S8L2A0_DENBC|nr:hypothetical protein K435DRAFT_971911 [Dendrothele bispora CBS 962.96]